MIRSLLAVVCISLLSACASAPLQFDANQKYSTEQISDEMKFHRAVHRFTERLYAGDDKQIVANYKPLIKEHRVASRMASKRHAEILVYKEEAAKNALSNSLSQTFYETNFSIIDIDNEQQSVTLRSNITALYPFLWRFDFVLIDGEYYLEDIFDVPSDISEKTMVTDGFDYIMYKSRKNKFPKNLNANEKRAMFAKFVMEDLAQDKINTKLLSPEVVYAAFNVAAEHGSFTQVQADKMAAYFSEHKESSLPGFQLQADAVLENKVSALKHIEALAPRLAEIDPVGLELSRAIYLLKTEQIPQAAAATRRALDKESLNPWPYVFTRRIAKETNNASLLSTINKAIDANFDNDLSVLDQFI